MVSERKGGQIRAFLATRLVVAVVAALVLGTLADRLGFLSATTLGQGSGIGTSLFLLAALIGFFVALPPLLLVLHVAARPGCPPLWQALFTAFLAIWAAALWISVEFGHVAPHLLAAISAHTFMIYGMPAAVLFWLSARGPLSTPGPGTAPTLFSATPVLLALSVVLLFWEVFSRGILLRSTLGQ